MDFQLSDEQTLLRDTTADLLTRSYGSTEIRNQVIAGPGWSPDVWRQLAETGILGLGLAPEAGGQIEIMLALIEVGRRLAPEPVLHAALAPGAVIAETGTDEQRAMLAKVEAGEWLLTFAHLEPGMRGADNRPATRAVPDGSDGDTWLLTGTKNPVLAGDAADIAVVSAVLPDGGTGLFLLDGLNESGPSGLTRRPYRTFDSQRGAQLDLDGVRARPLGADAADASAAIERAVIRTQAGLCAEAIGAMEESLHLTTKYLKSRKQFGVTLNTFQTLTQRAADMYVSLELARSMNLYASMSIADGIFDPVIAARAKLQIGRSGRHIAQEGIQLHGGIGMTWEYPMGHYAARLTAIEHTLGSSQDHLHTLIGRLGDYDLARI